MEQKLSKKTRTESDLIGSREVPESALYGVQTLRGIENFRISKFHLNEYPLFIQALAITKMGAAIANRELDLLTKEQTDAILKACKEILEGKYHDQFPVDMIQGGAGTTTNMNANEVIANRALELMGHQRGEYQYCSPNDHVNRSQSTNDAYPTAIHIGLYYTHLKLVKHFETLIQSFRKKGEEFAGIIEKMIHPSRLNDIRRHQEDGNTVYVISASIDEWVAPWCKEAGIDHVLGTKIEVDGNGILTGRFLSPNCYGQEKVNRLLEKEPDRDSYILYAYGDSRGDRELLAFADKGIWCNKNAE